MAIQYGETRSKLIELSRINQNIVDMLVALEKDTFFGMALTPSQIIELKLKIKSAGDDLKTVAGEIKELVKE